MAAATQSAAERLMGRSPPASLVDSFVAELVGREPADVLLMRDRGAPFNVLPSGEITNQIRVRIANRSSVDEVYTLRIMDPAGVRIEARSASISLAAGDGDSLRLPMFAPAELFSQGHVMVRVEVSNKDGSFVKELEPFMMKGPVWKGSPDG